MANTRRLAAFLTILAALVSVQPAWARYQPRPCKNAFSFDQETAAGAKAKAEVYKTLPVLPDSSPITEYIQKLGAELVAHAPGYRWSYEFHVVNQAEINAFALPGGPVFINLGTIQAAESESQLAGVMAHEISHVVQRHATCNETKQRTSRILAGIGEIAAGVLVPGVAGAAAQQGIGAAAGIGYLHMSRDSERQADLMGVDILYDTGYDPRGLPQFFEIIAGKYGSGGAQWLSDHPNPGNRTGYVNDEIDTLPRKAVYLRTSDDFTDIKSRAARMHAFTAREIQSGVWRRKGSGGSAGSDPAPQRVRFTASESWKQLETARYKLSYPDNWKPSGSVEETTIAPDGGVDTQSADGDTVTCGVLVGELAGQPSVSASLGDGFSQWVRVLMQQNPGLKQTGPAEDLEVNHAPAKRIELTGLSARAQIGQQAPETDWLAAISRSDGTLATLIFVAPAEDSERLRPAFERMLRSYESK